ncbi:COX1 domain containing protein [Trichuris trichiura]|uniref:Cytochrome c oxidase subunit 1 n=1 Tax=Trichuris trichiura TaxID=36087 RepID=A0A077ZJS0_TRITR|nr:COX1 domain containing protein [Trichuris trichiura]
MSFPLLPAFGAISESIIFIAGKFKVFGPLGMIYAIMSIGILGCFVPLMLWVIGFLVLFTIGGLTGVSLSNASLDLILHDTYYVVGHLHFVLSMGVIFAMMAFLLIFIGANLTFIPQHFLGINGIPRRYLDYNDCFHRFHYLSSLGRILSLTSTVLFLYLTWERITSHRHQITNSAPINSPEILLTYPITEHTFLSPNLLSLP